MFKLLRRLYDWVLSWTNTKYAPVALFLLAFAESSFFPIPPDILLIALAISLPKKSFKYALLCSAGSVLGGIFGYYLGYGAYDLIGAKIINSLGYEHYFELVGNYYRENAFLAVFTAAFTPIPYKVFTIAAGFWKINLITFVLASIFGRSLRFFIAAVLIYLFGARIKNFIDKYFNLLTIIFMLLLIGGFLIIKYLI